MRMNLRRLCGALLVFLRSVARRPPRTPSRFPVWLRRASMACRCRARLSRSSAPTRTRRSPTGWQRRHCRCRARWCAAIVFRLKVAALGLPPTVVDVIVNAAAVTADVALTLTFSEQVQVTVGSRAAGAEGEKAVPVDVITQDQIAATGFTETAQVIEFLAPSFNFPRPTITDGTDTVRPATLRGLGPDQVLVLVNGKRRHQSALVHLNGSIGRGSTGVDLNAIPLSAIEHIEVLRDGAAAQCGSDAIAGVINLVLKSGVARPSVTTNFGLSTGSFHGQPLQRQRPRVRAGRRHRLLGRRARRRRRQRGASPPARAASPWPPATAITTAPTARRSIRAIRSVAGDAGSNPVAEPNHRWGDPDTRDTMTFVNASVPLNAAGHAFDLRLRRLQPPRGEQRRLLPPRARRAQLAADLPARLPAADRADRARCVRHRRRARRARQVELRLQRRIRPQQLRVHGRRFAQRVARTDAAAQRAPTSTPARSS